MGTTLSLTLQEKLAYKRLIDRERATGLLIGCLEAVSWQVDEELKQRIEKVLTEAKELLEGKASQESFTLPATNPANPEP